MEDYRKNASSALLNNMIAGFGHVYYALTLEVGANIEAKAIKTDILGDIKDVVELPIGDSTYFNHRLCEALDVAEKGRLKEALNSALENLGEYEIECRIDPKRGPSYWIINKGKFIKDLGIGRIVQYGFISRIPAKMLKRNEYGTGDDRYHRIAGLMNDYVFSVRCKNGEVIDTIHGGACQDVTGYSEQEFLDDNDLWFRMVHPRDKDLILDRANKMAKGEKVDELVHRIKHKNGQTRWVKSVIIPHFDEFGNVFLYDGVIRDITDQIQEQHRLEQMSYMNELLLDATPYPMILMQNDGLVLKANKAGYEMGARDEETCSTMWKKEIDATCEFRKLIEKSMDSDSMVVGDITYQDVVYEVTIVPNEPDLLLACLHNVTHSRAMQDCLEEDKTIMQAVFDNTIASIMLLDVNGKFEAINATAAKIIDHAQAEVTGLSLYEIFPRDKAKTNMDYISKAVATHQSIRFEESVNGYDLVTMVIPVVDKNSDISKVAVFSKDNTKMKKAEANLIETYQVLTTIVESSPLVIIGLDINKCVILWNRGAELVTNIKASDAYGKDITQLYSKADEVIVNSIQEAYDGKLGELLETDIVLAGGVELHAKYNIAPKMDANGKVDGVIFMAAIVNESEKK